MITSIPDHIRRMAKKWSGGVKTKSMPKSMEGLFKKDGETIAMGLMKESPKGPKQAIEKLMFYINRAGKNLPADRKKELNKAKKILEKK